MVKDALAASLDTHPVHLCACKRGRSRSTRAPHSVARGGALYRKFTHHELNTPSAQARAQTPGHRTALRGGKK